jgi:hypothetical protein
MKFIVDFVQEKLAIEKEDKLYTYLIIINLFLLITYIILGIFIRVIPFIKSI